MRVLNAFQSSPSSPVGYTNNPRSPEVHVGILSEVSFFFLLFSFITILNYFCFLMASFSNHSLSYFLFSLVAALITKARSTLLTQILPWLDLAPSSPGSSCRLLTFPNSLPCSPSPSHLLKTPTFQRAGTLHLCLQKFSLSIWPTF